MSAIAKNGVELRSRLRVTVRTNLDQLIGGATEETIIARVGQGIVSAIGSSQTHMEVMETPDRISKGVLSRGLDASTAFEIVSIDMAEIDVGENIGARLQSERAEADTRMARAEAEMRRAEAIAFQQEMKAKLAESRSMLVLAEAEIPLAMAGAFRRRTALFESLVRITQGPPARFASRFTRSDHQSATTRGRKGKTGIANDKCQKRARISDRDSSVRCGWISGH